MQQQERIQGYTEAGIGVGNEEREEIGDLKRKEELICEVEVRPAREQEKREEEKDGQRHGRLSNAQH